MIVYKAWLETRWKLLATLISAFVGVALTLGSPTLPPDWIERAPAPLGTMRGYVWSYSFKGILMTGWALFAVVWASMWNSAVSSGFWTVPGTRGEIFTLSLPVTRRRLLAVNAGMSALSLTVVSLASALLVPVLAGTVFSIGETLMYALFIAGGGMVIFTFGTVVALVVRQPYVTLMILLTAIHVTWPYKRITEFPRWSVYHVMSGESWFLHGQMPWPGLALSLAAALAFFFVAVWLFERQDV